MKKENKSRSAPPPLPDPTAAPVGNVEPPPLIDSALNDSALNDSALPQEQPSDQPPPSEPAPPADPVAEFLSRAGAVLALERGMNARSRVKLAAVADELGLSDDEFERVMEKLLSGETTARKKVSREEMRQVRRQRRAFHDHVGETLMALPHGVLTSSMEQMLVQDGVNEHGMSQEDALADILKLTKQLRIRRITFDEAQRHIAELIDRALENRGALRADVRQRIIAEGTRWGLTPDQVEPILRERISRVRMGERKDQMRMVALVSVSAAVLVGVLGMIAWMAFTRALPDAAVADGGEDDVGAPLDAATPPATDGEDPPSAVVTPPTRKLGVPAWWNDELASFIANVRLRVPTLENDLYQLRSPDPDVRKRAYRNLLTATTDQEMGDSDRSVLAGLFAAAYAVEPSDECAQQLRNSWSELAVATGKELPEDFLPFQRALWAAQVANSALIQTELSDERRSALLNMLERTYQANFDRDLPPLELQKQINGAAGAALYKSLNRHATQEIDIAIDLHKQLLASTQRDLDVETSERLAADYLRQVLPKLGDRWQMYEDLIRRVAMSEDRLNVLLMLEVFEATDVADLQGYLGAQLVVRTGLSRATPRSAEELAADVRDALGVRAAVRPVDAAERAALWRSAAEEQLAKSVPSSVDEQKLLQDVLDAARLSTLGAALIQGELAAAEFNALWEAKPFSLADKRSTSGVPRRAPRVNTSTLKSLGRSIDSLRGYSRLEKAQRVGYLQLISGFGGSITDVQPDQGQTIASYLATAKPVDEHERVMELSDNVLRWRMVRLGLADDIADSRLRTKHLGELLTKALRREVDIEADGWRGRLRDELLASVARELDTEAELAGEATDLADRAAKKLTEYYRTQAKLRGIPASSYNEAHSPSQGLLLLIQHAATKLSARAVSASGRKQLEQIPHELIAIDYLAESDLAHTVGLQRLWAKLLSLEFEIESAMRTGGPEKDNETVGDLLQQVAAGERELLALWVTGNKP